MLTLYKCNNLTENIRISLTLDRLIEKLKLIVISFILKICLSSKQETNVFVVDVNRINFIEIGYANIPKLVFFDDRDEITKDTVRAELEILAQNKS